MMAAAASHHFWDHRYQAWTVPVLAGEWYVTDGDEHLTTVLGSCVATCVRDRVTGIGGMNHLLLPEAALIGRDLVAGLIDDVLAFGGHLASLEIMLFGGGRVIGAMSDVGAANIASVHDYLARRGLPIVLEDIGGTDARRLRFHPRTGRTKLTHMAMASPTPGALR